MSEGISKLLAKAQSAVEAILETVKTHTWYWVGGGSAAAVLVVVLSLFGGGLFGPSGKDICTATLNQAKDFGVLSPSAVLASNSAKSTDIKNRRSCTASADGETFTLQVDLRSETQDHKVCKDVKTPGCVALYSVARSDGMTTYQVREIPPGETDEAILAAGGPAGGDPAQAGAAPTDQGSGMDTDTAVDNSTAPATGPVQTPASVPPSGQPR